MSIKRVLYMHTGSGNHGCEAIVRTTSNLLNGPKDVILWSNTRSEDIQYGSAQGLRRLLCQKKLSGLVHRILKL